MSALSALTEPTPLLIGFAAMTFVVAGASFISWNAAVARDRIARRLDALRPRLTIPVKMAGTNREGERDAPTMRAASGALLKARELEVVRRLAPLHLSADRALAIFFIFRLSLVVLLALIPVFVAYQHNAAGAGLTRAAGLGLLASGFGWLLPHIVIGRMLVRRERSIEKGLPDAIELLVISAEAGLALEDAVDRIVPELRHSRPAVAEELALTSADLKILPSRDAALHRLSARVAVPSVHSVVTTLSQTMRYGTPLAQALHVVAAELRNDSLLRLEEQANRMPVLLTVPMVLFILPSIFMIIGGPAALRLIDTLSH